VPHMSDPHVHAAGDAALYEDNATDAYYVVIS
jgi:hypothetical protein